MKLKKVLYKKMKSRILIKGILLHFLVQQNRTNLRSEFINPNPIDLTHWGVFLVIKYRRSTSRLVEVNPLCRA